MGQPCSLNYSAGIARKLRRSVGQIRGKSLQKTLRCG
jgi:hypothetical protein